MLVHKEGKPIYPCPSTGKWLLYCPICWLNCQKISLCIGTYVFVMSIAFSFCSSVTDMVFDSPLILNQADVQMEVDRLREKGVVSVQLSIFL